MKKLLLLFLACQACSLIATAQFNVTDLRTENLVNPIGLDAAQPRFTWQLASEKRNVTQSAYEYHYAYGTIGDWMYRVMVGLDTYEDGVGYSSFIGEGDPNYR